MSDSICSIAGCDNLRWARGWCTGHYTKWRRHGDPLARNKGEIRNGKRICTICDQDKPIDQFSGLKQSWCKSCFAARKRGKPRPVPLPLALIFCVECGTRFSPAKRTIVCCSEACSTQRNIRFDRLNTMTYRALKLDAWSEDVMPAVVYERDAWICQLCHEPIDRVLKWPDPRSASVDHALPLSRGGLHSYANTQASHLHCNTSKQDRVPQ